MELSRFQQEVFLTAVQHGWWPMREESFSNNSDVNAIAMSPLKLEEVNIPEKLALMHSEISEALEHYRQGSEVLFMTEDGKPDGMWIELADCIIRILDLAGAYGIDMEYYLRVKADYNKTRPYRHGDKKC